MNSLVRFACLGYTGFLTDDDEFFIKEKITFFASVAGGFTFSLLSLIATKFKNEVGLYRDDGFAIYKATRQEIENRKQEVNQVFKSNAAFKSQLMLTKRSSTFLM